MLHELFSNYFDLSSLNTPTTEEHVAMTTPSVAHGPAGHLTAHRPASTLELFFDLVFVFAITQGGVGPRPRPDVGWCRSRRDSARRFVVGLAVIYALPDLNGRAVVGAVIALLVSSFITEHLRMRGHNLREVIA
ncbi:MAG: hypothetical protein ACI8Y4_004779 [Candidatus Poriferisodalaceae bacterium]|jgi:hypothetical protein